MKIILLSIKLSLFCTSIDDGQTQRGCGSEVDSTECTGELCAVCPLISGVSEACNVNTLPVDRLTCYSCTGNRSSTCGAMNSTVTEERSVLCPLFQDGDRCVATRRGDTVERGCFSSMQSVNCDITHNCCNGHGCNHMEWDLVLSGAVSINSVLKIVTIALFGVIVGYNNL